MDTAKKVDALMIPGSRKVGKNFFARVATIGDYAEPLLQTDLTKGERAHIRQMPNSGKMFVTNDPADTIYFPQGHNLSGLPRYNWVPQEDGTEYGYLVEDAKSA